MSSNSFPDDPKPWTVLNSKYLWKRPWLTVRQEQVQLPSGTTLEDYYVFEYSEWVNALAITTENQLVMVRQYRHALGRTDFELPGGVRDATDPTAQSAAQRELLEETGFGGGTWEHFMTLSPNPSTHANLVQIFLARGVQLVQEHSQEQTEDIRVHLVKLEDAQRMVLDGGMVQSLHIAPLLKYLLLNKTSSAGLVT